MEGEFLVCTPSSRLKSIEIEEDLDLKFFCFLSFFLSYFFFSFSFVLFIFLRFSSEKVFQVGCFLNGRRIYKNNLKETNYITEVLIDPL